MRAGVIAAALALTMIGAGVGSATGQEPGGKDEPDNLADLDEEVEKLEPKARELWPDTFAGLWVEEVWGDEEEPERLIELTVFIAFTEGAEEKVAHLGEDFPRPELLEAVTFERSLQELEARQAEIAADRERIEDGSLVVPGIPERFNIGIDVKRNAIYITVEDASLETVAAFKERYGDDVIVEEGPIGGPAGDVGAPPAPRAHCRGRPVTILGTWGKDMLRGTADRDVIHGRGGNDVIRARGGDDVICTGRGNDRVHAGGGNDLIFAIRGRNHIDCGPGRDVVVTNRISTTAVNCQVVIRR